MPILVEPGRGVIRYGLSRRRASTAARASSSRRFFSAARSSVAPQWAQTTGSFGRGLAVAALNFVLPDDGHLSVTLICVMKRWLRLPDDSHGRARTHERIIAELTG